MEQYTLTASIRGQPMIPRTQEELNSFRHRVDCAICKETAFRIDSIHKYANTMLRWKLPIVNPADMTICEQEFFDRLPNTFVVMRGYATFGKINMTKLMEAKSWTLDSWTAGVFERAHITHLQQHKPFRDGRKINSIVYSRQISKSDVLAICFRCNEYEVILK